MSSLLQTNKNSFPRLNRSCLVLIGMPGSGKSTLGRILCSERQFAWVDTDHLMQAWWGMPLQTILDHLGMDEFLDAEAELVKSLNLNQTVISTGGSVVYKEGAMQHLGRLGRIVYLRADVRVIASRIKDAADRGMVMYNGLNLEQVYNQRRPLYEKYAELVQDTDRQSPGQCARFILTWLQKLKK